MKGWVYVITNESMPGLVKVGWSRKDPAYRAKSLDGSGTPYPYQTKYVVLVDNAYEIEQAALRELVSKRVKKEGCRCYVSEAGKAIRD